MSQGGRIVEIGTEAPSPPPNATFAIVIDFEKGSPNPQRVFQAADAMITAFQGLDRAFSASIDSKIEPIMVLEDIEAGSIKAWLSNQLARIDDGALKELDWKQAVGKYLVRAKYAVIRWTNKEGADGGLAGLARELRNIASETDVKKLPDYAPPAISDLADGVKRIDRAKGFLQPNDKMTLDSIEEGKVSFNLAIRWTEEELATFSVKEVTTFENMSMTLIVKKPDYLGNSKWDFRFGKKAISAKIDDVAWLSRFQNREIDIRPGDALKCIVKIEHKYGFDNELVGEDYTVTRVDSVLVNQLKQDDLDL